jgi:multicomponent Na+:H+ antiporter subunit E
VSPEESAVRRAEPLPARTTRTTRDGRVRPVRRRSVQWPMVLWLTLVWWLLWGTWSLLSLVGGVLVAVVASLVFPLPPLRMRVRVRPVGVVVLVARFLLDVVVASAQVARTVLLPPPDLRSAMVRVPLRTESDLVLVAVAEMTSLVPGTVVVEVHRPSHTLFLHVLDAGGPGGDDGGQVQARLDEVRARVWAQEERIVRALGADPLPPRTEPEEER